MNERLQFSWAHIIAFLAIIVVSYISFMGFTYLSNGNFTYALIGMGIIDIFYLLFFIGAQQMKASGVKMKRKIVWERIFIFGSPIVFLAGMIPMSHFFTVWSHEEEIVGDFRNSISGARQLFTDYEEYSGNRLDEYEAMLSRIIARRTEDPMTFSNAGFRQEKYSIQKENMLETLRLRLLSQNYDTLNVVANKWITDAAQGASTWNVFLLGNTREIRETLTNWENQLKSFSAKKMSNEEMIYDVFEFRSDGATAAIKGLDTLTESFTTWEWWPSTWWASIIFGIVIYLMLLFPYFIQDRHSKNTLRLVGNENTTKIKKKRTTENSFEKSNHSYNDETVISNFQEDDDYPSF